MLPTTDSDGLAFVARGLTINSRISSERAKWDPFNEQLSLWRLMDRHRKLLLAKPRKTGISTAAELADLCWTSNMDVVRNRVRTVFAIDEDGKAGEHLDQFEDFADQLKLPVRVKRSKGEYQVKFRNGSRIDCITAGGENPGRGGNINRLHVTELPFWSKPRRNFQNLRSACHDDPIVIIETTMDSIDDYCEELWTQSKAGLNEFTAYAWFVEDQESYRAEPSLITDLEWEECRKEGFRIRSAAAWWLRHALPNLCGNDKLQLRHDFPQKDDHLFAVGIGRVIEVTPSIAMVYRHLEVPSISGDMWRVELYGDTWLREQLGRKQWVCTPITHSGQVVVSIDTAMGRKKTNSVVLATDKRDRRILGALWSSTIRYDDIARVAGAMRHHFSTRLFPATVVCENDGVGDATCERLDARGIPHEPFSQTGGNQEKCITGTKRRIEAGAKGVPKLLRDECKKFVRNEKGDYEGPKDCVMTYGMALTWIDEHPFVPAIDPVAVKERKQRVYLDERLAEDDRTGHGRPPWGS